MTFGAARILSVGGIAAVLACAGAAPADAEVIKVTIGKLDYNPARISAHVGDTIEWTNTDFVAHTATARDKAWDVVILASKTGRVVLSKVGDIDYYCRFHPTMVGHISVTAK